MIYFFRTTGKNLEVIKDLHLVRPESFSLKDNAGNTDSGPQNEFPLIFVPSRRQWSPQVLNRQNIEGARANLFNNYTQLRGDYTQYGNSQMADAFYAIELNGELYQTFLNYMKKVFPDFVSFATTKEDNAYISYKMSDGHAHRADFLGDGVISVMRIIAYLIIYHDNESIVIDEPELSLHPTAQRRLLGLLAEFAKTRQIIMATHSPYLINWKYIKNGAKISRLVKKSESTHIFMLGDYDKYSGLISGNDWQKPFLADDLSKEIFFNDNILFVEGQDDQSLLTLDNALNDDINIYGYGVGGYHNFKFALQLARDIGVAKACVLIDGGEEEARITNELREKFPEYEILQWNREDIRDKDPICRLKTDENGKISHDMKPAKEGYFDRDGHKKPSDNLDDYNEKIARINGYFS